MMAPLFFRVLFRKGYVLWNGSRNALCLNARMLWAKLRGRGTLVFNFNSVTQLPHLEPVIIKLRDHANSKRLSFFILTAPSDIAEMKRKLANIRLYTPVFSIYSSRLLLLCDFFLSVDQCTIYPFLGCRIRACSFHGQPSKGNTYPRFNYKRINTLFFYGPLMRDHYMETKQTEPAWPDIDCYDIGQPLSDRLFNNRLDKVTARHRLAIETDRFTVLYAPSFEYCSSMATHGTKIIDAIMDIGLTVIVKPHPAFYLRNRFSDEFNRDIPNIRDWYAQVERYDSMPQCVFRKDDSLDAVAAISAADIMLTDYSGVAFDGILLDLCMIYWDCPLLYSEYLPRRYGIDGNRARNNLACNVGRDAGIVVHNVEELAEAIAVYRKNSRYKAQDREEVRERLLYNPGIAAEAMARKIEEIMGINND
ncbi:MAG: CDP-glycerol glycerophosphotransferase family protein [Pirellulales bacterium]|nr:CDP-glycerol glycerophosphotransferase family protein [Pirellulales bacterium]